jgi:hypothetical protein
MSEGFDPYYSWLGIPPKDQPPHHYRLLGIDLFENNANVIESAADRQMAHLRTFQTGKHSALSQRLLNEVAAARVSLLKPAKKSAYDKQLRARLEAAEPAGAAKQEQELPPALAFLAEAEQQREVAGPGHSAIPLSSTTAATQRTGPSAAMYLGAATALLLVIAGIWAVGAARRGSPARPYAQRLEAGAGQRQTSGSGNAPDETARVPPPPPLANPPPETPETPSTINPPVTAAPNADSQTIDLLALVEPAKHTAGGRWELRDSGLALVSGGMSVICPPVIPDGSFELETEFTFTRSDSSGSAALCFPMGNSFAMFEYGSFGGESSSLFMIDGHGPGDRNNPTFRRCTIRSNVRYKLAVRVQYFGDNQVKISGTLDGASLFRWQGPVSSLSGFNFWPMSKPAMVGLGGTSSSLVFHVARLHMFEGQAKTPDGKILVAAATQGRPKETAPGGNPAEVAQPAKPAEPSEPVAKVAQRPTEPPPVPPEPEKTGRKRPTSRSGWPSPAGRFRKRPWPRSKRPIISRMRPDPAPRPSWPRSCSIWRRRRKAGRASSSRCCAPPPGWPPRPAKWRLCRRRSTPWARPLTWTPCRSSVSWR